MSYLHKEKQRLVIRRTRAGADRSSKEKIDTKTILLCCCCCLVALLAVWFVIAVLKGKLFHFHKKSKGDHVSIDCNNSECLGHIGLSKIGFPKNWSELASQNCKLCKTVTTGKEGSEGHIYILKNEKNLTELQACGIESILRLFPDRTIYLIDFNKKEDLSYNKCTSKPNYLGLLVYLYKDRLELVKADKDKFFKDTPLHNVTRSNENSNFLEVLLTAYKYGGFVTTPDVIMTSRDIIECFPEEVIVEPFGILSSKKCNDFLHYLMQSYSLCQRVQQGNVDTMLSQSVELFSRSQYDRRKPSARRMGAQEVCSNVRLPCTFLRLSKEFSKEDPKMIGDIGTFCKQVVQAYLGIKINQMEVEKETSQIKSAIVKHAGKKNCESLKFSLSCNNPVDTKPESL